MRRISHILVTILISASVFGAVQVANGVSGTTDKIYACSSNKTGAISKVSSKVVKCAKGSNLIKWNIEGVQGLQGLQGEQGLRGAAGMNSASLLNDQGQAPGTPVPAAIDFFSFDGSGFSQAGLGAAASVLRNGLVWGVRLTDGKFGAITSQNLEATFCSADLPGNTCASAIFYSGLNCTGTQFFIFELNDYGLGFVPYSDNSVYAIRSVVDPRLSYYSTLSQAKSPPTFRSAFIENGAPFQCLSGIDYDNDLYYPKSLSGHTITYEVGPALQPPADFGALHWAN